MLSWKLLFVLLNGALLAVEGANILFFFGLSTYSHRIAVWPLVEKLAERGHDITFVQPFKPKKPNPKVKEYFPKSLEQVADEFEKMDLLSMRLAGGRDAIMELNKKMPAIGLQICEAFLTDSETEMWIQDSKFDLVVVDALMNDCAYSLVHIFGAKSIIYGTTHPLGWWADTFGIPVEASSIDDFFLPYNHPMTWYEKAVTSIFTAILYLDKQRNFYPMLDEMFQKQFKDPNFPSVAELERKTSLIFTNTHFSEEHSRSLPPFVVSVGGMHCADSTQKLTKELETFLNGCDDSGFIYISFGSAAKISNAPKEFQNIFYTALGRSKGRFVWKYDGTRPTEMPDNVFTGSWLPQQAILGHPKIKAFFTHGGLLGIHEALWYAVPLIPMPIFAEQDYNALRVDRDERGIMLDPETLTVEKMESAIHQVTTDPKYKRNMEKASKLFKDRPEKPVDTAVWWTEYVLRNDEADLNDALQPLSKNQTWYERRLLDVWLIVFFILLINALIFLYILIKIFKFVKSFFKKDDTRRKIKRN